MGAPAGIHTEDLLKAVLALPDTDPIYRKLHKSCSSKEYDTFARQVCHETPRDMAMLKEMGTNKSRPLTAYYCGNPNIDWSGEVFQGKPRNDLCSATFGDAYKAGGVCGKYSDKEFVMSLIPSVKNYEVPDPRMVNVPLIDCIVGLQDCNVYMCHHCPGRCSD